MICETLTEIYESRRHKFFGEVLTLSDTEVIISGEVGHTRLDAFGKCAEVAFGCQPVEHTVYVVVYHASGRIMSSILEVR